MFICSREMNVQHNEVTRGGPEEHVKNRKSLAPGAGAAGGARRCEKVFCASGQWEEES